MFDILATAMHDEEMMESIDKFYREVKAVNQKTLREHIKCPSYGQYILSDFENGVIDHIEGEDVTLDTVLAYGVNYKSEGITSGLATLAYIESLNDEDEEDDLPEYDFWGNEYE